MNKRLTLSLLTLLTILALFTSSQNTRAVDVCATENLNNEAMAQDNCPSAGVCGNRANWSGNWLPFKAGMGCTTNYSESVCGCENIPCCNLCSSEYKAREVACNMNPNNRLCYWNAARIWTDCQNACGGCSSSTKKEKTPPAPVPAAPLPSKTKDVTPSPSAPVTPQKK